MHHFKVLVYSCLAIVGILYHYVGPCYWEHSWGITSLPGICSAWGITSLPGICSDLVIGNIHGGIIPRTVARAGLTRTKPHIS